MKKIFLKERRKFFGDTDAEFQWRYSSILALAVGITICLFQAPFVYLLNENFEIFKKLAMDYQPQLLIHLEREIQWITFSAAMGGTLSKKPVQLPPSGAR